VGLKTQIWGGSGCGSQPRLAWGRAPRDSAVSSLPGDGLIPENSSGVVSTWGSSPPLQFLGKFLALRGVSRVPGQGIALRNRSPAAFGASEGEDLQAARFGLGFNRGSLGERTPGVPRRAAPCRAAELVWRRGGNGRPLTGRALRSLSDTAAQFWRGEFRDANAAFPRRRWQSSKHGLKTPF